MITKPNKIYISFAYESQNKARKTLFHIGTHKNQNAYVSAFPVAIQGEINDDG